MSTNKEPLPTKGFLTKNEKMLAEALAEERAKVEALTQRVTELEAVLEVMSNGGSL